MSGLHCALAVVLTPGLEQLRDLTANWIVGLHPLEPLDGITTSERYQRVTAPLAPLFVTAQWTAPRNGGLILATPPPDRQRSAQELGSTSCNLIEKTGSEGPLFRVFAACIELG